MSQVAKTFVASISGVAIVAACAVGECGCSSFLHWNDPTSEAVTCGITSAVLNALQAMLVIPGVVLGPIEAAYSAACQKAAAQGMTEADAQAYGLEHARAEAMKMAVQYKAEHP